jgi:hypothetical protein
LVLPPPSRIGLLANSRRHHDLDAILVSGKARLHGCANGHRAPVDPGVPRRVHHVEICDVAKPYLGAQELGLVTAGLGQTGIDLGEDLLRLRRGVAGKIVGGQTGQVDGTVVAKKIDAIAVSIFVCDTLGSV